MNKLLNLISKITLGGYITKPFKNEIKLLSNDNNTENNKNVTNIVESISKSATCTKKLRQAIDTLLKECNVLDNIIPSDNTTTDDKIIEIDDNDLESMLDVQCTRYNKFTESNPAEHIMYDKNKNRYIMTYNNKTIKRKDKDEIINLLKISLGDKYGKTFSKIIPRQNIKYKDKKIIIYIHGNKPYFDINHIINLFDDIKIKYKKYDEYKGTIELYDTRDNQYGGFYIKEFINQETFFKMLLHTNSIFSNKFKDDVAKLLNKLSCGGSITIQNDKLKINNSVDIDPFKTEYQCTQTYDNAELVAFIRCELAKAKAINFTQYDKVHCMYMCITTFKDPQGLNRILCKIGYTCNIVDRIKSLKTEYKCDFYLLGIRTIYNVQCEQKFHQQLRQQYPNLVTNIRINGGDKNEIYCFDKMLYGSFTMYENKIKVKDTDMTDCMDQNLSTDIVKYNEITNEYQKEIASKHYDYLMDRANKQAEKEREDRLLAREQADRQSAKEQADRQSAKEQADRQQAIELKKLDIELLKLQKNKFIEPIKMIEPVQPSKYLLFLNKRTEASNQHISNVALYNAYKIWSKDSYPDEQVPNNRDFNNGMRKHKVVERSIKINQKATSGIKNLKLKDLDD
jgi:hypothetical protein